MNQEMILNAINKGIEKAKEIGSPSSIAIVDSGRNLVGFYRMEKALLASIEISQSKAFTSSSLNMSTADLGPLVQPGAPLFGIERTQTRALIPFGGGFPITVNGEIVGAIGVSGGSADQDSEIATAALKAFE